MWQRKTDFFVFPPVDSSWAANLIISILLSNEMISVLSLFPTGVGRRWEPGAGGDRHEGPINAACSFN